MKITINGKQVEIRDADFIGDTQVPTAIYYKRTGDEAYNPHTGTKVAYWERPSLKLDTAIIPHLPKFPHVDYTFDLDTCQFLHRGRVVKYHHGGVMLAGRRVQHLADAALFIATGGKLACQDHRLPVRLRRWHVISGSTAPVYRGGRPTFHLQDWRTVRADFPDGFTLATPAGEGWTFRREVGHWQPIQIEDGKATPRQPREALPSLIAAREAAILTDYELRLDGAIYSVRWNRRVTGPLVGLTIAGKAHSIPVERVLYYLTTGDNRSLGHLAHVVNEGGYPWDSDKPLRLVRAGRDSGLIDKSAAVHYRVGIVDPDTGVWREASRVRHPGAA